VCVRARKCRDASASSAVCTNMRSNFLLVKNAGKENKLKTLVSPVKEPFRKV